MRDLIVIVGDDLRIIVFDEVVVRGAIVEMLRQTVAPRLEAWQHAVRRFWSDLG